MGKKRRYFAALLVLCLLLCGCASLGGCAPLGKVRQVLDQASTAWEKEESEARRREADLAESAGDDSGAGSGGETREEAPDAQTGSGTEAGGEAFASRGAGAAPGAGDGETAGEDGPEEVSFTSPFAGTFAYDSLPEAERVWYRNINRVLGKMQEKQELAVSGIEAGLDETHIDRIFQCVMNDHPEYFYVEGYTYTKFTRGDKLVKLEFSGAYSMKPQEAAARAERIEAAAAGLLAGISPDAADYDKVKYVYETLIRATDYDLTAEDNQNIYSVFVNHRSVCQGYAKATQYLLNRLGMECAMVMGTVDTGEGHAWNLVRADGAYYYLDTTWGDASYRTEGGGAPGVQPDINYDYLLVTTQQLLRTHTLGGPTPMPQCVAMEDNYYIREGLYFTGADPEQLTSVFQRAMEQNRNDVTLKCADLDTYRDMERSLIEEQEIFRYLEIPGDTICYAGNEKQLSITFWMTN